MPSGCDRSAHRGVLGAGHGPAEGTEQLLIGVLSEQECSFLVARWAAEDALEGAGSETLVAAFGIDTADAGHALAVVVAGEETGERELPKSFAYSAANRAR
jgi:hypothetical protein